MESDEDDEETQASFCGFLDDNFKLPISAYAPGCVPKVEIKERLFNIIKANFLPCDRDRCRMAETVATFTT